MTSDLATATRDGGGSIAGLRGLDVGGPAPSPAPSPAFTPGDGYRPRRWTWVPLDDRPTKAEEEAMIAAALAASLSAAAAEQSQHPPPHTQPQTRG